MIAGVLFFWLGFFGASLLVIASNAETVEQSSREEIKEMLKGEIDE